jgi:hypothetical protein
MVCFTAHLPIRSPDGKIGLMSASVHTCCQINWYFYEDIVGEKL